MITMEKSFIHPVPYANSEVEVLQFLEDVDVNSSYVNVLKESSLLTDELLSDCLDVSVKTFRTYKNTQQTISFSLKEHIVMLISLFQHGNVVFGSSQSFENWLFKENLLLFNKKPSHFLKSVSGIRLIDDRLTGMEYGDNV